MRHFQGYLRKYTSESSRLVIRLFAGTLDPGPEDEHAFVIVVHGTRSLHEVMDGLSALQSEDARLYVSLLEESILSIESENGTELRLQGECIEAQAQPYGPEEWEWLARANQERANDLDESLVLALSRLNRIVELLVEQQSRVDIKSQGHAPGTTARTLYEQHAAFLARLRSAAEA